MTNSTVKTNATIKADRVASIANATRIGRELALSDVKNAKAYADRVALAAALFSDDRTMAQHDAIVKDLRTGYMAGAKCEESAAKKAIQRLLSAGSIERPVSMDAAAVAKRAQREKDNAVKAATRKAETEAAKSIIASGKLAELEVLAAPAGSTRATIVAAVADNETLALVAWVLDNKAAVVALMSKSTKGRASPAKPLAKALLEQIAKAG